MQTVNIAEKFGKIQDYWNPRVLGELNDFAVKAVKLKGEFVWHHHDNEDELFLVVKGTSAHEFPRPRSDRPRRRIHHRASRRGASAGSRRGSTSVLLEPRTTLNTGNVTNERTVRQLERI